MAIGPGKYDDLCTTVREYVGLGGTVLQSGGGVILIVIGGDHGNGFSCQADLETTLALPDILEDIAKQIRKPEVKR
jgi:hypothetical protein